MSKWNVYVSSTFKDLKDFRAELINLFQNQLQNNFELSKIMERMFDDGTYTPYVDDCVEAVLGCDIYIIILGNRTGSFPPDQDRTYTEFELDAALANDKRIFCLHLETFNEAEIDNKVKHQQILDKFKGRPIHTFKDSLTLKNALYEFLFPFSSQSPINKKNPYQGLASFGVDDGDYFFGRDAELEGCLKKIVTSDGNFFVSVIGNSGTGKSSFVQAGLLFRLKNRQELGFTERLQIIVTPGSEPFTNLKYQLQLQGITLEDILNANSETTDLIIYFDQFEEVITQCHSPEAQAERKQLFDFLDMIADNQNKNCKILVICTFRSDFLSQLANFDFIKSHQYLFPISSLDYKVHSDNWEQSMTEIIARPALKNGVVIEKELVEQLLEEIKEVDGSLPILQFTLERIWNNETIEDRRISVTEYSKLSEGKGISGIIETHAENVIKSITNNGQDKVKEAIIKGIFINLVEVNENLNDVKRTVAKDELFSILKQHPEQVVSEVFETLVSEKCRLLNISQDKDKTINVGIIHEELIRKWERLKGWINERREALENKKRISLDITAFNKGEDSLYGRKQLKRAYQWKTNNPDLASDEINIFLQKARKRNSKKIYKFSGMTLLITVLLTMVITFWVQPTIKKLNFKNLIAETNQELSYLVTIVGGIDSLSILHIRRENYAILSGNFEHLGNLKDVRISNVGEIKDLSLFKEFKNPSLVTSLHIDGSINSLAGIENLTNLSHLSLDAYDLTSLTGIESLTNLSHLSLDGYSLTSLAGIEKLPNLSTLVIPGNYLHKLADLEELKNITTLIIQGNGWGNDANHILQRLVMKNFAGIEKLPNLTTLTFNADYHMSSLAGIENLTKLKTLTINDDGRNVSMNMDGIEKLTNLSTLILRKRNLQSLSSLTTLTNLTYLSISSEELSSLSGIEYLTNLTNLTISGPNYSSANMDSIIELGPLSVTGSLTNLTGLEKLTKLSNLNLLAGRFNMSSIEKLANLSSLTFVAEPSTKMGSIEKLTNLTNLTIVVSSGFNFDGIEKSTSLTTLNIIAVNWVWGRPFAGSENVFYIPIELMTNLTSLYLDVGGSRYFSSRSTFPEIEKLTNLTSLTIKGFSTETDLFINLSSIENLTNLTNLTLDNNVDLKSIAGIEKLTKLTTLSIVNNPYLGNWTGIDKLTNLKNLTIKGNVDPTLPFRDFNDVVGLEKLINLRHLTIEDISASSLAGIEQLTSLSTLDISGNSNRIESILYLEKLTSLDTLIIGVFNPKLQLRLLRLKINNPDVKIIELKE